MPATFNDLIALMDRLRSPGGCPWDREQTYATLAPMLLEEAYEAFDAVEEARAGRPLALRDELGDLLFQIVFYAQVAKERGEFTIADLTGKTLQQFLTSCRRRLENYGRRSRIMRARRTRCITLASERRLATYCLR